MGSYRGPAGWTKTGPSSMAPRPPTLDIDIGEHGAIDGLLSQAIGQGKVFADDGSIYDTIQDAENAATAWMFVGPGTFQENVTVDTPDLDIIGAGRQHSIADGQNNGNAIDINADNVSIKHLGVQTDAGGSGGHDAIFNDSGDDLELVDIAIISASNRGVMLSGVGDVNIWGLEVLDYDGNGVRLENADEVWIDHIWAEVAGAEFGGNLIDGFGNSSECHVSNFFYRGGNRSLVRAPGNRWKIGPGLIADLSGNAVQVSGDNCLVDGIIFKNCNTDINVIAGATDLRIGDVRLSGGGISDSGTRTMLNGQYINPPTIGMSGSNGSISPTDNELNEYTILVDAGGSAVELQGIDSITDRGTKCTIIHTGGETITIAHKDGGASNPLWLQGEADFDLTANDQQVSFQYDGTRWREISSNLVT